MTTLHCTMFLFLALSFVSFALSAPLETCNKSDKCTMPIASTQVGCGEFDMSTSQWIQTPDKKMWTFDKEQKKCVPKNVSACNTHTGNIFEADDQCISTCVPN